MNKNVIVSIAIVAVIFIGAVWLARPGGAGNRTNIAAPGPTGTPVPTLFAAETFFNFGEISMARGEVKHEFKVTNQTAGPIKISKIYTSCMCTVASIIIGADKTGPFGMPGHGLVPKANVTLAAGAEATIEVAFDPAAHGPAGVGRVEREIYLEEESGAQTILKFEVTVTP